MAGQIPPINGLVLLVSKTINLQLEGIGIQATVSNLNDQLTTENQNLATAWTSCDESNPNDPAYLAYYTLQQVAQNTDSPVGPDGATLPVPLDPQTKAPMNPPPTKQANVDDWITLYLGGTTSGVSQSSFSSAFLVEVYNVYMNQSGGPQANDPALGLINSMSSWVSTNASSDEKTGQNLIQTTNNLAQHFESDNSPLNNIGSSIVDASNNYASALSAISA